MRPRTLWYYVRETASSLRRNYVMAITSIVTVMLAMLLFGTFFALAANVEHVAREVESQIEITCYLADDVSAEQIPAMEQSIVALLGVQSVEYVSRDEALLRLRNRLGDNVGLLGGYNQENNPLQDSFLIKATQPDLVFAIADEVEHLQGIAEVRYGRSYVNQLLSFTTVIRFVGIVMCLGLGGAALFIIVNTIRLTVVARQGEIEIMRHVGATSFFITVPFFLEGLILGITGSALAYGVVVWGYYAAIDYAVRELPMFTLAPAQPFLTYMGVGLVGVGAIVGAVGSNIALGRHLKV